MLRPRGETERRLVMPSSKAVHGKSDDLALDYQSFRIGRSLLVHADALEWLGRIPENSIHGIVTDPPYGVKEYHFDQIEKRANGNGRIWRIPPSFDGSNRQPLPRFTALNERERAAATIFR
jgi:site-specific DNA-methyltransferase (adenine-specific)